jgi:hypothetical protein
MQFDENLIALNAENNVTCAGACQPLRPHFNLSSVLPRLQKKFGQKFDCVLVTHNKINNAKKITQRDCMHAVAVHSPSLLLCCYAVTGHARLHVKE